MEEAESEQFGICMVMGSKKESNVDKRMRHRGRIYMAYLRRGGGVV